MVQFLKLFIIFHLLPKTIAVSQNSKKVFYKLSGKQLTAKAIKEVNSYFPVHCLAFCLYDESCKSYNFYHGMPKTPLDV